MVKKRQLGKRIVSLRIKLALASIITLCTACFISGLMVILGFSLLYKGPITSMAAVIMCLIVCFLTMLIGGIALWHEALYVTKPLNKISEGVKKVADGDFSVQIVLDQSDRRNKNGTSKDEIDELTHNFNKMVLELHGMDYMRKDFMSNVSHEIKTPVAAITGFSEILIDGGLNEQDQKEYLTYLNQESERLSRLCDNMLRMSRLDNQFIVDRKQEVSIDEQIRRCIILLEEKWTEKNINFDLQLQKCSIYSDQDLLFQIWTNLIDNAMKYSRQKGNIWIAAHVSNNILKVTIKDQGIGISSEKQGKIYDKFYQCDESHKKQGCGLGLSIVKRIIELLNGSISCESEEGKGTTMIVELQVK